MTLLRPGAVGARRRLVLVALVAGAGALLLGVLAVGTTVGQRWDDEGFEGRKALELAPRRAGAVLLRMGTPVLWVVGGGAVVAAGWLSGRRARALAAAVTVVVAPPLASAAKRLVTRPDLWDERWSTAGNTFPSGHMAVAAAVSGAVVLVWGGSASRRPVTAAVALNLTWATLLVGSGWHRPADVVGGVLVASAVAATAGAVAVGREAPAPAVPPASAAGASPAVWPHPALWVAVAVVALGMVGPLRGPARPDASLVALGVAWGVLVVVSVGSVAALAAALAAADPDPAAVSPRPSPARGWRPGRPGTPGS